MSKIKKTKIEMLFEPLSDFLLFITVFVGFIVGVGFLSHYLEGLEFVDSSMVMGIINNELVQTFLVIISAFIGCYGVIIKYRIYERNNK